MIDNIVTNTLLPALSRTILNRTLAKKPVADIAVSVRAGAFTYDWAEGGDPVVSASVAEPERAIAKGAAG